MSVDTTDTEKLIEEGRMIHNFMVRIFKDLREKGASPQAMAIAARMYGRSAEAQFPPSVQREYSDALAVSFFEIDNAMAKHGIKPKVETDPQTIQKAEGEQDPLRLTPVEMARSAARLSTQLVRSLMTAGYSMDVGMLAGNALAFLCENILKDQNVDPAEAAKGAQRFAKYQLAMPIVLQECKTAMAHEDVKPSSAS